MSATKKWQNSIKTESAATLKPANQNSKFCLGRRNWNDVAIINQPPQKTTICFSDWSNFEKECSAPPGSQNWYNEQYSAKSGERKTINNSRLRKLVHINGTFKAAACFDLLGNNALPILDDSALLQQDNAPSYFGHATQPFWEDNQVVVLPEWRPYWKYMRLHEENVFTSRND